MKAMDAPTSTATNATRFSFAQCPITPIAPRFALFAFAVVVVVSLFEQPRQLLLRSLVTTRSGVVRRAGAAAAAAATAPHPRYTPARVRRRPECAGVGKRGATRLGLVVQGEGEEGENNTRVEAANSMRAMVQATKMRTNATVERRNRSGAAVATRGEVVGVGERERGRRLPSCPRSGAGAAEF